LKSKAQMVNFGQGYNLNKPTRKYQACLVGHLELR